MSPTPRVASTAKSEHENIKSIDCCLFGLSSFEKSTEELTREE